MSVSQAVLPSVENNVDTNAVAFENVIYDALKDKYDGVLKLCKISNNQHWYRANWWVKCDEIGNKVSVSRVYRININEETEELEFFDETV
jgi:uncharacterized protein YifN (PemK superfamily)